MSISVASRKDKGRRLQKWVAKKVSGITGFPFGKDEPIESREMGQSGVDVKLHGDVRILFPYAIECKNQETWSLPKWVEQARKYVEKGYEDCDWLLIVSKNNYNPIVVMDAERFFENLGAMHARKQRHVLRKKRIENNE